MIRVSEDAKRLLSTLWAPEGEVMRLVSLPEAEQGGEFGFLYGRGEGADQIIQHGGRQVLRIVPSVREEFDGSTVEVVEGALGVVPPHTLPAHDGT